MEEHSSCWDKMADRIGRYVIVKQTVDAKGFFRLKITLNSAFTQEGSGNTIFSPPAEHPKHCFKVKVLIS